MEICFSRTETSTTIAGPKNASSESSCEPDQPSRTCNGASACVPTCGLAVKEETLTLAPAPISDDQPQVKGVSPGHSGVSGLRVTLMSFKSGSLPFIESRPLLLPYDLLSGLHDVVYCNSEVLVNGRTGSGCAETLETEDDSVVTDPLVPRHGMCCFHGDTLDAFRQDAVPVRLILACEDLMTGHADRPCANAVCLELLLRIEYQRDFRSAGDQDDFRRTAW